MCSFNSNLKEYNQGAAWPGMARQGVAWLGMARPGVARLGAARQGMARIFFKGCGKK